jgi:hypothetical protein
VAGQPRRGLAAVEFKLKSPLLTKEHWGEPKQKEKQKKKKK